MNARLDRVLHDPSRIRILGRLLVHGRLQFSRLRGLTGLTPGNLANHLKVLEKHGHVATQDAIVRLRPGRVVALTPSGRLAFQGYIRELERLVNEMHAEPPVGLPGGENAAPLPAARRPMT